MTKRDDWIDLGSTAGRDDAGGHRDGAQQNGCCAEQRRIACRDFIQLRSEKSAEGKRAANPDEQSDDDRLHSLRNNQPQNIPRLRTQRHPQADLARPLLDCVGDRAVNPDESEKEREQRESREQTHRETLLA